MESKSLLLNGISWSIFRMGERTWLLRPQIEEGVLEYIHKTTLLLEDSGVEELIDIIPAYDSLTIIFNSSDIDLKKKFSTLNTTVQGVKLQLLIHEVKVCYEVGLDWLEMEQKTRLTKEEIISIHSSKEYTIAMTGFLPGFIFLDGLDERIAASRKKTPRTSVPKGSVGIGGNQTGIYSLESPGGWQIIGKTPQSFFSVDENPPMQLKAGDKVKFIPVSKSEFVEMEKNNG